jgi:hypothetical protein
MHFSLPVAEATARALASVGLDASALLEAIARASSATERHQTAQTSRALAEDAVRAARELWTDAPSSERWEEVEAAERKLHQATLRAEAAGAASSSALRAVEAAHAEALAREVESIAPTYRAAIVGELAAYVRHALALEASSSALLEAIEAAKARSRDAESRGAVLPLAVRVKLAPLELGGAALGTYLHDKPRFPVPSTPLQKLIEAPHRGSPMEREAIDAALSEVEETIEAKRAFLEGLPRLDRRNPNGAPSCAQNTPS